MGLLAYGLIALAVIGSLSGLYFGVHHSGVVEGRAEIQPKLEACQTDVEKQNAAVKALRDISVAKQAEGAKALAAAEGRAKTWDEQAKRLTAILVNRKPGDATDCKTAWQEIRK